MVRLDYITLQSLEDLLEMETGYVLDFSNSSFERFVKGTIGINIYKDKGYEDYCSKANKLRDIFEKESTSKVTKLINELLNYYEDYKLKMNELTDYDKKKISDIKETIIKTNDNKGYIITEELDEIIQMISTRQARFKEMSLDEKLKEIGNLIEHLLKRNGKYLSIDYHQITLGFIREDDVISLRKKVQCFRHSTAESLEERNTYTKIQKEFIVEYGIITCDLIYKYFKESL